MNGIFTFTLTPFTDIKLKMLKEQRSSCDESLVPVTFDFYLIASMAVLGSTFTMFQFNIFYTCYEVMFFVFYERFEALH